MQYTGNLVNVSLDYKTRKPIVSLVLNCEAGIEELRDKQLDIELKVHKEKRSLNSNNYAWVLITELGNVLRESKEELYFKKLKDYGQSMLIPVPKGEKPNGYFKYYEYFDSSLLNGKEADWYKVYKGSSEFDTQEMSIFIDGLVQDCKEQNIPTLEDKEIKRMCEQWV